MLRVLSIRDYVIVDRLEIELGPGFTTLTGETGAGKSILVEAVGLLLGGRASGDLVRTGEDVATIEAIFESGGEELLVRREITSQGRSRAYINGELATAGALRDLSRRLIELHGQPPWRSCASWGLLLDIHGQHEHQLLLPPAAARLVDAFGGHEAEAGKPRSASGLEAPGRAARGARGRPGHVGASADARPDRDLEALPSMPPPGGGAAHRRLAHGQG